MEREGDGEAFRPIAGSAPGSATETGEPVPSAEIVALPRRHALRTRHYDGPAIGEVAAASEIAGAKPQRKRRSDSSITPARRRRFLDGLTLTCNVAMSAQHAGCSLQGLYLLRQRDEAFAAQWRAALATGYDRLEALVLEHGGAGVPLTGDPARGEAEGLVAPPFDFEKAMKVLAFGRAARNGERTRRTGRPVRNATREETNAALLKALAAAARRQAKRDDAERDNAERDDAERDNVERGA